MPILPLSVVIITHNEDANIARAIKSVQPICEDIIVVDGNSTDNTVSIAENLGAKVIFNNWQGYSKQKNVGNAKAKNNYIFSLDADEAFSEDLVNELVQLFNTNNLKPLYALNRLNHFGSKPIKHGAWHPDWQFKLFDKTKLNWVETDDVHENLNWDANTEKGKLNSFLLHYTTPNETYYLQKMDKYAQLFADKMHAKGKSATSIKAHASAYFRFCSEYIFNLGFLDGTAGLKIAKAHLYYTKNKYLYLKNKRKRD